MLIYNQGFGGLLNISCFDKRNRIPRKVARDVANACGSRIINRVGRAHDFFPESVENNVADVSACGFFHSPHIVNSFMAIIGNVRITLARFDYIKRIAVVDYRKYYRRIKRKLFFVRGQVFHGLIGC